MMRLQKIGAIIFVMAGMSCHQLAVSIDDTLHGTPADSSKRYGEDITSGTTNRIIEQSSSSTTTVSSSTVHSSSGSGFLGNAAKLKAAEQALRSLPAFAGKDIYLYEAIHFYDDGRIQTKVQNPHTPTYIDAYTFSDGSWQEPKPVQLSVHDDIAKKLVKLDDISFSSVEAVRRNYSGKADSILGAVPINYVYAIFGQHDYAWYPQSINGSRERYFISFTKDGSLQSFYRQ
jgi:hypothetical protein